MLAHAVWSMAFPAKGDEAESQANPSQPADLTARLADADIYADPRNPFDQRPKRPV